MKKLLLKIKYLSVFYLLVPASVLAYNFNEQSGLGKTASKAGYTDALAKLEPENLIVQGLGMVFSFVGVLFLIMMIFGGLKWMIATGNDTEVAKAKKIVVQGIVGVLIIFAAYAITYFVVQFFGSKTLA